MNQHVVGHIHTRKERPLVSVVVPVHNAEAHVRECLDSLRAQSLPQFEVIVVLDAPTDGSAIVAEEFAEDSRFRVISHLANHGVAAARNTGLAAATGQFVGFVDADDYVTADMFALLATAAVRAEADIASSGHCRVSAEGVVVSRHEFPVTGRGVLDESGLGDLLRRPHATSLLWFSWRNIYRRSMLLRNRISFDAGVRLGEDVLFNLEAFGRAKRWVRVQGTPYAYRSHGASATAMPWRPNLIEELSCAHTRKLEILEALSLGDEAVQDTRRYFISNLLPRMVSNVARHPDHTKRLPAMRKVVAEEMVKSSLKSMAVWDTRLPVGLRVMTLLAKLNQPRALLWVFGRRAVDLQKGA